MRAQIYTRLATKPRSNFRSDDSGPIPECVRLMKKVILLLCAGTLAYAQLATGELRLSVTDPSGLPLPSSGTLVSDASGIERNFTTNDAGSLAFQHLPLG